MRPARRSAAAVLAIASIAASMTGAGCGRTTPGAAGSVDPGAPAFAISGYVVGRRAGPLVLRQGADQVTIGADGPFTFASRLPDGAAYLVAVESHPADARCAVARGAGVIAAKDVIDVAVTCLSTDATLKNLSITPGALVPAFSPGTLSYTSATFKSYQQRVTVRAAATDPGAAVRIAGADVEPGAPVEIPLEAGSQTIAVTVTAPSGATASYQIAASRTPVVHIKASNPDAFDRFGWSSAVSGDTLAVGAIGESSRAAGVNGDQASNDLSYAGAAYLFRQTAGVWTQEAYLKASNPGGVDGFGAALAVDGDTLAVGAPGESSSARGVDADQNDDRAPNAGAVYLFERRVGIWTPTAYLKASNADAEDAFGSSIALAGDTLVVGAPYESAAAGDQNDNSAPAAGAAYVFERRGGIWTQAAVLKGPVPDANDRFGWAVALDGDTIVVGALGEGSAASGVDGDLSSNAAPVSGAAYVFGRAGGPSTPWTRIAYLKASNNRAHMAFGAAVSVSGETVVVGAPRERSLSTGVDGDPYAYSTRLTDQVDIGSAYVFVRRGTTFVQQAYLKAFGRCLSFGLGLAVAGDTVLVGSQCGAAYSYVRAAGVWSAGALVNFGADRINLDWRVALDHGRFVLTDLEDASAAAGVDPPPGSARAAWSGALYVFD